MYRDRALSIVAGRVVLVLRLVGFRLHRSDQLGLGLANLELLEPCRGLGTVRRAELRAGIHEVTRDGVLAEAQALGDVAVRGPGGRESQAMQARVPHPPRSPEVRVRVGAILLLRGGPPANARRVG